MNKKILFSTLSGILATPVVTLAACGGSVVPNAQTLNDFACNVQFATISIGVPIVIIGWVIAGILWLTAGGAPEKMGTAKKAMVACVIGTALIALATGSGAIIKVVQGALGIPVTP